MPSFPIAILREQESQWLVRDSEARSGKVSRTQTVQIRRDFVIQLSLQASVHRPRGVSGQAHCGGTFGVHIVVRSVARLLRRVAATLHNIHSILSFLTSLASRARVS